MWTVTEIVEGVLQAIDTVTHPRFYMPVFIGVAIAAALWTGADDLGEADARSAEMGPQLVGRSPASALLLPTCAIQTASVATSSMSHTIALEALRGVDSPLPRSGYGPIRPPW
jgi:hypothetical protein